MLRKSTQAEDLNIFAYPKTCSFTSVCVPTRDYLCLVGSDVQIHTVGSIFSRRSPQRRGEAENRGLVAWRVVRTSRQLRAHPGSYGLHRQGKGTGDIHCLVVVVVVVVSVSFRLGNFGVLCVPLTRMAAAVAAKVAEDLSCVEVGGVRRYSYISSVFRGWFFVRLCTARVTGLESSETGSRRRRHSQTKHNDLFRGASRCTPPFFFFFFLAPRTIFCDICDEHHKSPLSSFAAPSSRRVSPRRTSPPVTRGTVRSFTIFAGTPIFVRIVRYSVRCFRLIFLFPFAVRARSRRFVLDRRRRSISIWTRMRKTRRMRAAEEGGPGVQGAAGRGGGRGTEARGTNSGCRRRRRGRRGRRERRPEPRARRLVFGSGRELEGARLLMLPLLLLLRCDGRGR